MLGIGHVYWAMAAAVLVVHQGTHQRAALQRGAERVIGTLAGLTLAAAILSPSPQGLWLVVVVSLLQFAIQLFILRNYVLATVFITAVALTVASGAHRVDVGRVVTDRGLDTVIGCGVGIAVYLLAVRGQEAQRISQSIVAMMEHTIAATAFLARGEVSSLAARAARRDLQDSIFDLTDAEQAAHSGSRRNTAPRAGSNLSTRTPILHSCKGFQNRFARRRFRRSPASCHRSRLPKCSGWPMP